MLFVVKGVAVMIRMIRIILILIAAVIIILRTIMVMGCCNREYSINEDSGRIIITVLL